MRAAASQERRILVLAPTGKDTLLTISALGRDGIECVACPSADQVAPLVAEGVGAVLVAEEALPEGFGAALAAVVEQQPPWSDLPILVLTRQGFDSPMVDHAVQSLGNVVLLERPMRVASLASAVRAALRARARQYQVRSHVAQLERTEEALREASRRKDEFLAMLAHELRNPLAPIRSSLHVLKLSGGESAAAAHVREMMERQVDHLVRLVDDLMEVSRITRGKVELRLEDVDLAIVLRAAVEAAEPLMEEGRISLAIETTDEPIVVRGDAVRLAQVFGNLLNNAAKFTPPGGRVTLRAARQGESAVVSVVDTGEGIPADVIPHVFELFTQGDRSQDRVHGGLGIGLTLVRGLTEMHGGSVEARSAGRGRGSEFIVRLPALGNRRAARTDRSDAAPGAFASQRILVVDDNRDAADSLGTLLRLLGADVRVVYGGEQALELLKDFRPGVAFVDIGMPGMDGYEMAREVRRRPDLGSLMLVALTGWGQEEDRRRSREAGFDHHLIKPTDVSTLQGLLER